MFDNCSNIQARGRIARRIVLLGLMAAASGAMAATETLYYFVDDRGIPHFTNVPTDARYRPFAKVSVGPAALPDSVEGSVEEAVEATPYSEEPMQMEEPLPVDMDHDVVVSDQHLPVQMQEH